MKIMKKLGKFTGRMIQLLIFISLISLAQAQNIPSKPEPAKFVVDYADALYNVSTLDKEKLENKLKKYADSTSTQIVIVIIKYLEGKTIVEYAQKLGETWGIGQKGKDNGILILVAYYDHQVRIHTGYGVEAKIPDVLAKQIIDNQLVPNFKANNYYQGLDEASNVIFKLLSGEFKASDIPRRKITFKEVEDFAFYVFITAIFVGFIGGIIVLVLLPDFIKTKKGWLLGPSGLGTSAISLIPMLLTHIWLMYSWNTWEYWQWVAWTYSGMTLFLWFCSNGSGKGGSSSYSSGKSWSSSSSYSDSSSSYSDSSSSYSDSSYGGGSFGGGGASGSW